MFALTLHDAKKPIRMGAVNLYLPIAHFPRNDVRFSILGIRVRPGTLCRITEFSEHESNGRELDEGERVAVEVCPSGECALS